MAIDTVVLAVGEDTGERARRLQQVAMEEADARDARVVVVHVFDEETVAGATQSPHAPAESGADALAREYDPVRDVVETLESAGLTYEVRGAVGDPGEAVVSLAESVGADRIVVGGRRRAPAGKATFGSTAQSILLSAECPVTASLDELPGHGEEW
ncbi:MAG: universal stress protein [Halobacteriaceae archaeon]